MNTQSKFPTKTGISIGIPAYCSEKNIEQLIVTLLHQKLNNLKLEKIIIHDDASDDNTYRIVSVLQKRFPDKIRLTGSKKNKGYAYAMQTLVEANTNEIFVIINDDIAINSPYFLEDLVRPLRINTKVWLVGGNIQPLPPRSFIGNCVLSSFRVFDRIKQEYRNGKSKFTCDGKAMAMRKMFVDSLTILDAPTRHIDAFLYMENLVRGGSYQFARDAKVYFRLPETISDFHNLEGRNQATFRDLKGHYGSLVEKEFLIPGDIYLKSVLVEFFRHPLRCLFFKLVINNQFLFKLPITYQKWELAKTTKM